MWVSQDSRIWTDAVADVGALAFTPLVLVSASSPHARHRQTLQVPAAGGGAGGEALQVVYDYVPGAGDDEESWAEGLTPQLLWAHTHELLAAGPAGISAVVQTLIKQQQQQHRWRQQGATPLPSTPPTGPAALDQPAHALLPRGCLPAAPGAVRVVGAGAYLLGATGLALGSAAAGAAPAVWEHARAVLHLGLQPLEGMAHEPVTPAVCGGGGGSSDGGSSSSGPWRLADPARPTRFLHLPVQHSKHDRHALQQRLPAALHFLSHHLQQQQQGQQPHGEEAEAAAAAEPVLVTCDAGEDASVCAVVACLLSCYELREAPAAEQQQQGAARLVWCRPFDAARSTGAVTKLDVRRRLAAVTAHYPPARPTRGMLRQVFNAFVVATPHVQP